MYVIYFRVDGSLRVIGLLSPHIHKHTLLHTIHYTLFLLSTFTRVIATRGLFRHGEALPIAHANNTVYLFPG